MADIKKYEVTKPWLQHHCSLGEGPFWEEESNSLRFVDIQRQQVHRVNLKDGPSSHHIREFDVSISCTADIEGNDAEYIFAGKYGYGTMNKSTNDYRWLARVWSPQERAANKHETSRANDGAVDSHGRFWAGFMFDPLVVPSNSDGAMFRLNCDLSLDRPLSNITIPNGTAWNHEDNTMYLADSPTKTIYKFDYNASTGAISNKRPFFVLPEDNRYGVDAVPDGHCFDVEGYMWTALHGGSRVIRISPAGEVVAEIVLPTQLITCPCFVGEDLFITSAGSMGGPDAEPIDEFAGCCFMVNVGVRGVKKNKFKMEGGK